MLLCSICSYAQKLDNNTLVHFSAGMSLGTGLGVFAKDHEQRVVMGFVSGVLLGTAKETYDQSKKVRPFQVEHVLITAAGGVAGALLTNWTIKRVIKKNKKAEEPCKM